MQRLGRKGHPVYRVVVQDSRQAPTSGKYVALLGSYDPHTKAVKLDKEKAEFYLSNGAQPSETVVRLFTTEKIKLPDWVEKPAKQKREIRNPEKLRRNRPADAPAPEAASEEAAADTAEETKVAEAGTEQKESPEEQAPEAKKQPEEDSAKDQPAQEPAAEESTDKPEAEESPEETDGQASEEKSA